MNKILFLIILILNFFIINYNIIAFSYNLESSCFIETPHDTIIENQLLLNGRVWRNLYYMVREDQFLFSKEFLTGSLTMNGKTFNNIKIRYDIYKDEILTPMDSGGILQLNKEMVDSFSILFRNRAYQFVKVDSLQGLKGYVHVLYKGKSALFVKYIKKIELLAVESKYDEFYQVNQIYFLKNNTLYQISSKKDLLMVFDKDKPQIKDFIKKNKIEISKSIPESFIPVIRYYDTINQ